MNVSVGVAAVEIEVMDGAGRNNMHFVYCWPVPGVRGATRLLLVKT